MSNEKMLEKLIEKIDRYGEEIVDLQRELVAIPALAPESGGEGEKVKSEYVQGYLEKLGVDEIRAFNAPDARVPCGYRPNLLVKLYGKNRDKTIWVMAHLDVVPAGDLKLWKADPFKLRREGDLLIGRGVEDNHQGLISGLLAMKAFRDAGIEPPCNLGLAIVADEETGSAYGLDYLMEHHPEQFGAQDWFLVPDAGDTEGALIEIAEKSILWLKVMVAGKQCHASTPALGINAHRAAAHLAVKMDNLEHIFNKRDELFEPPISTFEPTKREANVPNVNTIPPEDIFYFDCRVLPDYPLELVEKKIRELADEVEKQFGVTVTLDHTQRSEAAPPTREDAEVVVALKKAIHDIKKVKPRCVGIGGGTVAAIFRRAGLPAVVWSTLDDSAHQPEEFSRISFTLSDAKVMAHVFLQG